MFLVGVPSSLGANTIAIAVAAPGPRRGCRSWWAGRACEADGSAGKLTAASCEEEAPSGGAWATFGGAGAAGGSGDAGAAEEAASRRGTTARVVQKTLRCSCPDAELSGGHGAAWS